MNSTRRQQVIDFHDYIAERTADFTGREWVFQSVNDWLADPVGTRAFLLIGEPGSGKTAIAARLAQFAHGTISPPTGFDHLTLGFLSAVHFCSARDHRWISPQVFAQSLALQLADRYPVYANALAALSGDRQIRIDVDQRAQQVAGQMIGVEIKHLDVSEASAEDAFMRVVREPLEAFACNGELDSSVIRVDAVDEALGYGGEVGILELLAQAQYLPACVRFVLTSSPEGKVVRSLQRLGATECSLTTEPGLSQSLDDVREYVGRVLASRPTLIDKLAVDLKPETFATTVVAKSEGNFLIRYLPSGDACEPETHHTPGTGDLSDWARRHLRRLPGPPGWPGCLAGAVRARPRSASRSAGDTERGPVSQSRDNMRDARDWGAPVLYLRSPSGVVSDPVSDDEARRAADEQTGELIEQQIREFGSEGRVIGAVIGSMRDGTKTIRQTVDALKGLMIGARVFSVSGGRLTVYQKVDVVTGTLIGSIRGRNGGESTPDDERHALADLERELGALRVFPGLSEPARRFCPSCGAPAKAGDRAGKSYRRPRKHGDRQKGAKR